MAETRTKRAVRAGDVVSVEVDKATFDPRTGNTLGDALPGDRGYREFRVMYDMEDVEEELRRVAFDWLASWGGRDSVEKRGLLSWPAVLTDVPDAFWKHRGFDPKLPERVWVSVPRDGATHPSIKREDLEKLWKVA